MSRDPGPLQSSCEVPRQTNHEPKTRRRFLAIFGALPALAISPARFAAQDSASGDEAAFEVFPPAEPQSPVSHTIRIGVFTLFRPAELMLRSASGVLLVDAGGETVEVEGAQSIRLRIDGSEIACITRQQTFRTRHLHAWGRGREGQILISIPDKIGRRFSGLLEVAVRGASLVPVITVDRELAIASVLAAEDSPEAPSEALKAQAVVIRSYYGAARRHHPATEGFDFCDTTHCQFLREPPRPGSPAFGAVQETRGLVLNYRGCRVAALYSASCGGRTRTLARAGLGTDAAQTSAYPYYEVECDSCRRQGRTWQQRLSQRDAALVLAAMNSERARLEIARRIGWSNFPGDNYQVEATEEGVLIRGRGAGHGIGLCQKGAAGMATGGADFRSILMHYYPNTTIEGEGPP